jgi:hypothetical protein
MFKARKIATMLSLLALASLTACGGGGGDPVDSGGGSTTLAATFISDTPSPGPNTVSMRQGSLAGNLVTVEVLVTDTADLTGATFDLFYDSARFSFVTSGAGDLFEDAGANPIAGVNEPAGGHLVVGIGAASPVSVSGSQVLIRLTFRAGVAGSGAVSLNLGALQDVNTQSLPGISWSGGTLVGT